MEAPRSIADVEQLVKQLYQPGRSRVVAQIQDQLQQLQRSSDGWQMANALLGSEDVNVRFFGALTFTVKLNNDGSVSVVEMNQGSSLDADNARVLLTTLISWLVRLTLSNEGQLVVKKLCSCLATYFVRSPAPWEQPLRQVLCSFHAGEAVTAEHLDAVDLSTYELVKTLPVDQLRTLLLFTESLAAEVGKSESTSKLHQHLHDQMERNVEDAANIMYFPMTNADLHSQRNEALKCYLTWVFYAQPLWPVHTKEEALRPLRMLIRPAMESLIIEEFRDEAFDVFRDILENYTSFLQAEHLQALSEIMQMYIGPACIEALQNEDPDGLLSGQLLIAFSNATVQDLVEKPQEQSSKTLMDLQLGLLRGPGWPDQDDDITVLAVEFWNTYIEFVSDSLFSSESDPPMWLDAAKNTLMQAIDALWAKLWVPPVEVTQQWGEREKGQFNSFRTDVSDFLQSAFVVLGQAMLQQFVELALRSLGTQQWRAVEAALFCLNGVSDSVVEDSSSDELLGKLFGSPLFTEMSDFTNPIPAKTRRTAVDMLGHYGPFIERHAMFLPSALTFLFSSLETAALANVAAKSIASLCFSCRHSLTSQLDAFLQQYQRFVAGPTSDSYTKEKVVGAIAAIIQALPSEASKATPLAALLENVENDVRLAKECMAEGEVEMSEVIGVTALQCLASIGKASQVPDDVPVNLDDEDESTAQQSNFWHSEAGQAIQQRIMGCFSILELLGDRGEAVDAACSVLRSGYTETVPGPFVLPPSVTVSFVQQTAINTPRLEAVLSAACILITQHSRQTSPRIAEETAAIYRHVGSLLEALGAPNQDPELAQSCIDVVARLMPRYVDVMMNLQPVELLERIFEFIIRSLTGPDPLPKRSATSFWASFLKLQLDPAAHEPPVKPADAIRRFGPTLSLALVTQVGGNAQRSELEYLCEPLKALIFNHPPSRQWLEAALLDPSFPSQRVGNDEKRKFLQQVMGLRGAKQTNTVVKEFWITCRGTVGSFGS